MKKNSVFCSQIIRIAVLVCTIMLNSCVDEGAYEIESTDKVIGFTPSYTEHLPKATRATSNHHVDSFRIESSDKELALDVAVENEFELPNYRVKSTRGLAINAIGDWKYNVRAYYNNGNSVQSYFQNDPNGLEIASNNSQASTDYYWPFTGQMNFIAFAPASINDKVSLNSTGTSVTYTIPSSVQDQVDVMVAKREVKCPSFVPVDLQFKHMLSAVQFKVGKMQFIKINSLSISGLKGGTVTMTYDVEQDAWTYDGAPDVTYSLISSTDGVPNVDTSGMPEGSIITGNDNGMAMFVMPQSLNGVTFNFNYTQLIDGETKTKTVKFDGKHEWLPGTLYTYVINIGTDIIQIEIPTPPDADAHYVRVDMTYDLSKLKNVKDIKAKAYWENDGSNTASADKQDIKLKTDLTPMQKQGYFTDELWTLEYSVKKDGTTNPANPVATLTKNILGDSKISVSTGSKGQMYLFVEENDGDTDRNGVLEFTATSTVTNKEITIGKGRFKQLCPSWNADNIGVERFEDSNSFPWGYNYNRKVSYTSNITPSQLNDKWLGWLYKIYLLLSGGLTNEIIPDGTVAADGFIKTETTEVWGRVVIWYVELDYSVLNKTQSIAYSNDGLANTKALYKFTGNSDVSDIETLLNNNLSDWKRKEIASGDLPSEYAIVSALNRNRMRELHVEITSSEGTQELDKVLLHKVAEGSGVDVGKSVDETGEDLIEWFLPSIYEGQRLVETGTGAEATPISKLDGTYWSSNAGSDRDAQAYTFSFSNNRFTGSNPNESRLTSCKVRAVRKRN